MDRIRQLLEDPFAQRAVFDYAFDVIINQLDKISPPEIRISPTPRPLSGISDDVYIFHDALEYLTTHNPTRMKTIEQLELNYHKAVYSVKQQRKSAMTGLQTRQSLEMDILTAKGRYDKAELEALVLQHVQEMDAMVSHWAEEIRSVQNRQLREYKELVMEVYESEKSESSHRTNRYLTPRTYARPEVAGLTWISMTPVAAIPVRDHRARLIRVTHMKGDFLSRVVCPTVMTAETSELDPEELLAVRSAAEEPVSAVLLGVSKRSLEFNSNQDADLLNILDNNCPTDCRWPSLVDQIKTLRSMYAGGIPPDRNFFISRHSNAAYGVSLIFHAMLDWDQSEVIQDIIAWAEIFGVERLFLSSALVPDLRAPRAQDLSSVENATYTSVVGAVRRLSNVVEDPALGEIVIVSG